MSVVGEFDLPVRGEAALAALKTKAR